MEQKPMLESNGLDRCMSGRTVNRGVHPTTHDAIVDDVALTVFASRAGRMHGF